MSSCQQTGLPKHIAVIMDGNGRWAKSRGLPRVAGHKVGKDRVQQIIQASLDKQIPYLSLFAFSQENWGRPKKEVNYLLELFFQSIKKEINRLHEAGVKIRFFGNLALFPEKTQEKIQSAQVLTKNNSKLNLNILMSYGGRWEIVEASKLIAEKVASGQISISEITEDLFSQHLKLEDIPDPCLLIRTSGERRISNFLLWQLAYTELYFCDKAWPDFSNNELDEALNWFAGRQRRFGLISEQVD